MIINNLDIVEKSLRVSGGPMKNNLERIHFALAAFHHAASPLSSVEMRVARVPGQSNLF